MPLTRTTKVLRDEFRREISDCFSCLVRSKGLEPSRLAALPPQGSASTNSATTASLGSPLHSKWRGREQAAPTSPPHAIPFLPRFGHGAAGEDANEVGAVVGAGVDVAVHHGGVSRHALERGGGPTL